MSILYFAVRWRGAGLGVIDLEYDDVDAALAESVARLCDTRLARAAVVTGDEVATVATSGTVAWLPIASKVIALDDGHAYLARVAEPVTPVDSLAGEPWGRATLERLDDLGDAAHAIALGDVP